MRKYLQVSTAVFALLMGGGLTMQSCLADSEAQFQASSFAERPATVSESQQPTWLTRFGGQPTTGNIVGGNYWGMGPTWGTQIPWGSGFSSQPTEKGSTATPADRTPHAAVVNVPRANAQLAARPIYSSSGRTVIRRGTSSNSRYSYIKKQIRQAAASM